MPSIRLRFSWLEVYVVGAILLTLVAVLIPAVPTARIASKRPSCRLDLTTIGLALYNYHDDYGCFPPVHTVDAHNNRLHSWRSLILPYMVQNRAYKAIDWSEPWDTPANTHAATLAYNSFRCPETQAATTHTTYLAVTSPQGVFSPGKFTSLKQIEDGSSNTLLVLEVPASRAVPWMQPTDLDEAALTALAQDSATPHRGGLHALFADGSVRLVSQEELARFGRA